MLTATCARHQAPPTPEPSAKPSAPPTSASSSPAASAPAPSAPASTTPAAPAPSESSARTPTSPTSYAWLATEPGKALAVDGTLETRIKPPPGYARVRVEPGSFGEWLRSLPMAPADTAVTRFDGAVAHPADDEYVAAVVAIDIGNVDLQQSADVLIRLHAEWLWSLGKKDAISYPGGPKLLMPLSRWEKGQRVIAQGANVFWAVQAKPVDADYGEFRKYLDVVFNWANSASLSRRTEVVPPEALMPGDFFLHTKPPGHVAIVLDIAEKPSGERLAMLGQALSPTESVHVIRPGRATAWFSLRPGHAVITARSAAFGWEELRRLKAVEKSD
jgi:hypothetical protein